MWHVTSEHKEPGVAINTENFKDRSITDKKRGLISHW